MSRRWTNPNCGLKSASTEVKPTLADARSFLSSSLADPAVEPPTSEVVELGDPAGEGARRSEPDLSVRPHHPVVSVVRLQRRDDAPHGRAWHRIESESQYRVHTAGHDRSIGSGQVLGEQAQPTRSTSGPTVPVSRPPPTMSFEIPMRRLKKTSVSRALPKLNRPARSKKNSRFSGKNRLNRVRLIWTLSAST